MPWFRREKKKGRRKGLEVPEFPPRPIVGYVERLEPRTYEGVRLPRKIGSFDYVDNRYDLEAEVARSAGGGTFKARVLDAVNKKEYLGTHIFEISGFPLIDGERIEPKPMKSAEDLAFEAKIQRLEAEIRLMDVQLRRKAARERAHKELLEARAKRSNLRRQRSGRTKREREKRRRRTGARQRKRGHGGYCKRQDVSKPR